MKFGGMIGYGLQKKRLGFESDGVKGQGRGHEKVKNDFSRFLSQLWSDLDETNAKMWRIQFPIR